MAKRLIPSALAGLLLGGCLSMDVPEGAFFYPDARLAAEKITLPPDDPMAFPTESLGLSYAAGRIGATRVRTGRAAAPLILFCGGNLFRRSAGAGKTAAKLALQSHTLGQIDETRFRDVLSRRLDDIEELSRDLLEERARAVLGFADPRDYVIRVSAPVATNGSAPRA